MPRKGKNSNEIVVITALSLAALAYFIVSGGMLNAPDDVVDTQTATTPEHVENENSSHTLPNTPAHVAATDQQPRPNVAYSHAAPAGSQPYIPEGAPPAYVKDAPNLIVGPTTPGMLPPDLQRSLAQPPQPLPEEFKRQLNAPPPPLPPDLKAQLEGPPPELPEDLQRQLESPQGPLPDDIIEAMKQEPRVVTADEVNNP